MLHELELGHRQLSTQGMFLMKGGVMIMKIREMISNDWQIVSEIYKDAIKSNMATLEYSCPPYDQWDSGYKKNERVVAEKDGTVAGWAALTELYRGEAFRGVRGISVCVEASERGNGVGKELIDHMIEFADNNNIWTLQTMILDENEAAMRLFEKCGFRRVGYRKMIGIDRFGHWRNMVLLERRSSVIGFTGCNMAECKLRDNAGK